MKFKMIHSNYNVTNLEKSLQFYETALGLKEMRRKVATDGSFILVYIGNEEAPHQVELTWMRDFKGNYNLGDNEIHLAFQVDDFETALALHKEMDCVCFENKDMGIYFISDPDGYWMEVLPVRN